MFIRTDKDRNYSVINNTCFRDSKISARAKGIFAYIMTLPDNWELKQYELQNHFSEGEKALKKAFKELESSGYVEKTPKRVEGGVFQGWDYTIHETPCISSTSTETPKTDRSVNRQSVKGGILLSTKITLSTKSVNTEEVYTPISNSSTPVFDPNKPFEIVAEYGPDKKPDTDYENHVLENPPQIKPEEFRKLFKKTLGLGDKPGPPKISELKETPCAPEVDPLPRHFEVDDSIRGTKTSSVALYAALDDAQRAEFGKDEIKTDSIGESSPQETPNEKKEEEPSIPIVANKKITPAETIYRAYPKKTDKQKALPLIEKAVKAHSYDFIMQKVKEYAYYEKDQEKQYIPSPAVWFRNARWEDELYPRKKPSTTPSHKTEASAKKDSEWGEQLNF